MDRVWHGLPAAHGAQGSEALLAPRTSNHWTRATRLANAPSRTKRKFSVN